MVTIGIIHTHLEDDPDPEIQTRWAGRKRASFPPTRWGPVGEDWCELEGNLDRSSYE